MEGVSILDALNAIYEKYGIYIHQQQSFTCEGASGMEDDRGFAGWFRSPSLW